MAAADLQRLFFAVWPDAAARRRLADLAQSLDLAGGRLVHPDDLHLTLQFLGAVPAARLDGVLAAAAGVVGDPFEVQIDRTGHWPRPRVAWCAPGVVPAALTALVSGLGERLGVVGYPPETRPYRPHVTLARNARAGPALALPCPVAWPVVSFALAGSSAGPGLPRYRILRRWPLTAGNPSTD